MMICFLLFANLLTIFPLEILQGQQKLLIGQNQNVHLDQLETKLINFSEEFKDVPFVLIAINRISFTSDYPLSFYTSATNIKMSQFTLQYKITSTGGKINELGVNWIAFHNTPLQMLKWKISEFSQQDTIIPIDDSSLQGMSDCIIYITGISIIANNNQERIGIQMKCFYLEDGIKIQTIVTPSLQIKELDISIVLVKSNYNTTQSQIILLHRGVVLSFNEPQTIWTNIQQFPNQNHYKDYYIAGFSGFISKSNYDFNHEIIDNYQLNNMIIATIGSWGNSLAYEQQISIILFRFYCQPNCLVCQFSFEYCQQCNQLLHYYMDQHQLRCVCSTGYLEQNGTCSECSKTCETCTSNITLCNSCYPNSKRELVNNSCLCKDGFFDNLDQLCEECNPKCEQCITFKDTCVSCNLISMRQLNEKTRMCDCIDGTFENLTGQCELCNPSCSTCQSTATKCLSCDQTKQLFHNITMFKCECKLGFFFYKSGCEQCLPNCNKCLDSSTCIQCSMPLLELPNCACQKDYIFLQNECIFANRQNMTFTLEKQNLESPGSKVSTISLALLFQEEIDNVTLNQIAQQSQFHIVFKDAKEPQQFYPGTTGNIYVSSYQINSKTINFVLSINGMLFSPIIIATPKHFRYIFQPNNQTLTFEFLLQMDNISLSESSASMLKAIELIQTKTDRSTGLKRAMIIINYIGLVSLLINSPQAIGQLVFLDGLEPLNVYMFQVLIAKFSFRCDFGDWSYDGMQFQEYRLLWRWNMSKIIMLNIHSLSKLRKAKVTNNFLFNTVFEQILIILFGTAIIIVRLTQRKKKYFHQNLLQEQIGEEQIMVQQRKKRKTKLTLMKNIKQLLLFKIQTIWFILTESYFAWIMVSLLLQITRPTIREQSIIGQISFGYAFLFIFGLSYMYVKTIQDLRVFYKTRSEIILEINNINSQLMVQQLNNLQELNQESIFIKNNLQTYQMKLNHLETKTMIYYSFFIRNHQIPSQYHLFSFAVFLMKKFLYSCIIVLLYGQVYAQLSLLIIICTICLIYKIKFNPYSDRFEHIMSSLSDFFLICAFCSKISDYRIYRQIFESSSLQQNLIENWIKFGWITVSFELTALLFNFSIVFGEVIIHIRSIGIWMRRRCGFLFFQDDDEVNDEDFLKNNKNFNNHKSYQYEMPSHIEKQNIQECKCLSAGMDDQIIKILHNFEVKVQYHYSPPNKESSPYGQYKIEFSNLNQQKEKNFFVLRNLKYKVTDDLQWMEYREKTILLHSSEKRIIQLSFEVPSEDDNDSRHLEIKFILTESQTVYNQVKKSKNVIDQEVSIQLQANNTKAIELLLLNEYEGQWYTDQKLQVLLTTTQNILNYERALNFLNKQNFLKIKNLELEYLFYVGKYKLNFVFEDKYDSNEIFVNIRLFQNTETTTITINFEIEEYESEVERSILTKICSQFLKQILEYINMEMEEKEEKEEKFTFVLTQ